MNLKDRMRFLSPMPVTDLEHGQYKWELELPADKEKCEDVIVQMPFKAMHFTVDNGYDAIITGYAFHGEQQLIQPIPALMFKPNTIKSWKNYTGPICDLVIALPTVPVGGRIRLCAKNPIKKNIILSCRFDGLQMVSQ